MNYYWMKVSLITMVVLNITTTAFLVYQNQNVASLDDTRLPSVLSKLKNEIKSSADTVGSTAKEYSDKAAHRASEELKKFQAETTEWRAKMDKKIQELEKAARK